MGRIQSRSRMSWKSNPKSCAGCRSVTNIENHKMAFNKGKEYWFCRKCYRTKFNNDGGGSNLTVTMKK